MLGFSTAFCYLQGYTTNNDLLCQFVAQFYSQRYGYAVSMAQYRSACCDLGGSRPEPYSAGSEILFSQQETMQEA